MIFRCILIICLCINLFFIFFLRLLESIDVKFLDNNGSFFCGMGKDELLVYFFKLFWRCLCMICIFIIFLGWLVLIIIVVVLVLVYLKCKFLDFRFWW